MSEVMFCVAKEFDVVKVKLTTEGSKRVERLLAVGEFGACLGCEDPFAEGEEKKCGQCATCYNSSIYFIKKKKTTRQALIKAGKMLPPSSGGRKPANAFTKSLAEGD